MAIASRVSTRRGKSRGNCRTGARMTRTLMRAAPLAVVATTGYAQASQVTHVDHEKVAAALAKGGALVTAKDFTVQGIRRAGPGQVEIHEKETDIFYVTDGEATIVT